MNTKFQPTNFREFLIKHPEFVKETIKLMDSYTQFGFLDENFRNQLYDYYVQVQHKGYDMKWLGYQSNLDMLQRQYSPSFLKKDIELIISQTNDFLQKMQNLYKDTDSYIQECDIYPNEKEITLYFLKVRKLINSIPVKNLTTRPKKRNRIEKDKFLWDYGCFESGFDLTINEVKKVDSWPNYTINNDKAFVLSVLSEGLGFTAAERFLAKNRIQCISESKFISVMEEIRPVVSDMALESVSDAFDSMKDNAVLSYDGAWAHCRRSFQCIGSLIDQESDKIVGFGIKEDKNETPQSLESAIFKDLLHLYLDPKVTGHIQDGDVKNSNALDSLNKPIKRYLDRNHAKGVIRRRLNKSNKLSGNVITPFIAPLVRFFGRLAKNRTLTLAQKKFQWRNSLNHFKGYHDFCFHSIDEIMSETLISDPKLSNSNIEFPEFDEDIDGIAAPNSDTIDPHIKILLNEQTQPFLCSMLECVLESTIDLLDEVSPVYSTQSNESFNSIKIRFAAKNVAWKKSFSIRMHLAILQKNQPFTYYSDMLKRMDSFEIDTASNKVLLKSYNRYKKDKEKSYDPKRVEVINKTRYSRKNKNYKSSEDDHSPSRMKTKDMKIPADLSKFSESFKIKIQPIIDSTPVSLLPKKKEQTKRMNQTLLIPKVNDLVPKISNKKEDQPDEPFTEGEEEEEDIIYNMRDDDESDESIESDDLSEDDFTIPEIVMEDIYKCKSVNTVKPTQSLTPGIENVDCSCFINVGLQLLAHCKDFTTDLELFTPNNRFTAYLIETIKQLLNNKESIRPLTFLRSYRTKFFESNRCQNACKCLSNLIYSLMEENNSLKDVFLFTTKKEFRDDAQQTWINEQIDSELFIHCSISNSEKDPLSMQQLINNYITVSNIEVLNPFTNTITNASYQLIFDTVPKMLLVEVERLMYDTVFETYEINKTPVLISDTISIGDKIYNLKFLFIHFGSMKSGHYIGIVKNDGKIYKYNDAIVEELSEIPAEYFGAFTLAAFVISEDCC